MESVDIDGSRELPLLNPEFFASSSNRNEIHNKDSDESSLEALRDASAPRNSHSFGGSCMLYSTEASPVKSAFGLTTFSRMENDDFNTQGPSRTNIISPPTTESTFACFLSDADLDNHQNSEPTSSAPLKVIEDFIAKSMPKKSAVRRNIRSVKSLKELNPETRQAMEEENKRIQDLEVEISQTHIDASLESPDVEILTVDETENNQPSCKSARMAHSSPDPCIPTPEDNDIVHLSSSSNDIIFVGSKEKYPSISSFHCDDSENKPDQEGKILINTARMKRDPLIYVADHLVPHMRPHQIGGIRFMYATLVESIGKFNNSPGNGGVLAHSMGLGKTLQVITFFDAILRHTSVRTILLVSPVNVIQHWIMEFGKWMPLHVRHEKMKVILIRDQKASVRSALIKSWAVDGGILLLGYEKLRAIVDRKQNGSKSDSKRKRKIGDVDNLEPSTSTISNPTEQNDDELAEASRLILTAGEIVICDEGHRIKSVDAAVTKVLKKVSTRRRLILTGYPLQNNLMEYWCMIDFVRPFLLGTEAEFTNLFKNPIENGQCGDSSEYDRKLMRQRTYILQKTLSRIVQRRDSRPLIQELPCKREFAIIFRQTPSQAQLYRSLLDELTKHRDSLNAIALYTTFRNITQHPAIFFQHLKKMVENASANEAAGSNGDTTGPIRQLLVNLVREGKWSRFMGNLDNFKFDEIHSGKMLFLKHLVKDCVIRLKEKIIVFTQSIDVLDYLQEYMPTLLPTPSDGNEKKAEEQFPVCFRIDGSTSSAERERLINLFNDEAHGTQIFLISTEAGGIGINLTGACRVVLMDVSWNPSKDIQAISRIFRYGQSRISTIYRLVGDGSMEKCVFDRQIHKQCLFKRVVDDKSPFLAISQADLGSLFRIDSVNGPAEWHRICQEPFPEEAIADNVLAMLSQDQTFRQYLAKAPVVMDSILEADDTTQLTEHERMDAEKNFISDRGAGRGIGRHSSPGQFSRLPHYTNGQPTPYPNQGPRQTVPRFQLSLDQLVRDPIVRQVILDKARRNEDFYEELRGFANAERWHLVRHDGQGTFMKNYVLQPPGVPFHFVVRGDATVWRIMHENLIPPVPSFPSPLVPPRLPMNYPSQPVRHISNSSFLPSGS